MTSEVITASPGVFTLTGYSVELVHRPDMSNSKYVRLDATQQSTVLLDAVWRVSERLGG
jgi:hypothetical protein